MRESKSVKVRVCDECKKEVSDEGRRTFGGNVFNGWYELSKVNITSHLPSKQHPTDWDFCGMDCLIKFVDKYKIKKVSPRTEPDLAKKLYLEHKKVCEYRVEINPTIDAIALRADFECLHPKHDDSFLRTVCSCENCPVVYIKMGTRKKDKLLQKVVDNKSVEDYNKDLYWQAYVQKECTEKSDNMAAPFNTNSTAYICKNSENLGRACLRVTCPIMKE